MRYESLPSEAVKDYDTRRQKEISDRENQSNRIVHEVKELKHHYALDIHCGIETYKQAIKSNIPFQIKDVIPANWKAEEMGPSKTRLTYPLADNTPKTLMLRYRDSFMSAYQIDEVTVDGAVHDAFLPCYLAVQVENRLGLPTQGFIYHFIDSKFAHEYKINTKPGAWNFSPTHSTSDSLSDDIIDLSLNFVLLPTKLKNAPVKQHLFYRQDKLIQDDFSDINDGWLTKNAVSIDTKALISALEEPLKRVNGSDDSNEINTPPTQTHVVKIGDTWSSIAAKYGLAPKALLNLNMKFDKDPDSLAAGDSLQVEESKQAQYNEVDNTLPASAVKIENNTPNSTYQFNGKMLTSEVHTLKEGTLPFAMPLLNLGIKTSAIKDIDDCYLFFGDSDETLESFAEDVYGSDDLFFVEHIKNTNPHLKYSFGQIKSGMPVVLTTWKTKHEDEDSLKEKAEELMQVYLKLTPEEREFFGRNHDEITDFLALIANVNAETKTIDVMGTVDKGIASAGAVIAGASVKGGRINMLLDEFSSHSKYVAEQLRGLSGPSLYEHSLYKDWRKRERKLRLALKPLFDGVGSARYTSGLQAKSMGKYLSTKGKNIFAAKNFYDNAKNIDLSGFYKESMHFSRSMSSLGWGATIIGLHGNVEDTYDSCTTVMSEQCGRGVTRNLSSGIFNAGIGYSIGVALTYATAAASAPVSIVIIGAGALAWGVYGGDASNDVGKWLEDKIFE